MEKLSLVISLPNENSYQREQGKAAQETAMGVGAEIRILQADNDAVTQRQQLLEIMQSKPEQRPHAICSSRSPQPRWPG